MGPMFHVTSISCPHSIARSIWVFEVVVPGGPHVPMKSHALGVPFVAERSVQKNGIQAAEEYAKQGMNVEMDMRS